MLLAICQRLVFFFWGIYQDATMVPKFTDVDYLVFTDAARFVTQGFSPYLRDTYRYTPLLAWLLVPTTIWFPFGKILFILGDLIAGILMMKIFVSMGISQLQACWYVAVWLLNPMVSVISTRGSSEGLLGAMIMWMAWAVYTRRYFQAGLAAGLAIHFKLYPIMYVPTILLALGPISLNPSRIITLPRVKFLAGSAFSFLMLTGTMYVLYGNEYVENSWLHHVRRLDHRHNFSVYSTLLYSISAARDKTLNLGAMRLSAEHWAFFPQLILSTVLLPLYFAQYDILKTMFLQTFVFVTFNKVCTSQYFLWYLVLLPFYMPVLLRAEYEKYFLGILWAAAQALWLHYAYQLEFLGFSTFMPELFLATIIFFCVNIWATCLFIKWF